MNLDFSFDIFWSSVQNILGMKRLRTIALKYHKLTGAMQDGSNPPGATQVLSHQHC